MNNAARAESMALLELMRRLQRGPRREGVFALWMLCRVAWDIAVREQADPRTDRKRVALLEKRLAPLAVPRPLARGLETSLLHLAEGSAEGARLALAQLAAPSRDAIGPEAAEPIERMVRILRTLPPAPPLPNRA